MGAQRGGLHKEAVRAQSAVHLIGGHLQVLLALFPSLGIGVVPCLLGALQQVDGAHHVALHKNFGVLDGAVHVALGGKVDDVIEIVLLEQAFHQLLVADIALHEHMAGVALHVLQVFQIAGVGQLIQIDQQDLRVLFEHIMHKVGTDKTGAAGDQIFFHRFILPQFSGFIFLGKLFLCTTSPSMLRIALAGLWLPAITSCKIAFVICWPRPQQQFPASATGGGHCCCLVGEALAVLAKFPVSPEAPLLGELSSGARLRGYPPRREKNL